LETVITNLLTGELGVTTLLLLFILGILTKRFVPWWVHEEVVAELKRYEDEAPELTRKVEELVQEVRGQGYSSSRLTDVENRTQKIRRRRRDEPSPRRRSEPDV